MASGDGSDDLIERLHRQQAAIVHLAQSPVGGRGDLDGALEEIAMVAGRTVGVERTSVWLLSPDRQDIFCLKQYNFSTGSYTDFVPAREPPAGGYRALLAESGRRGLDICRREKDRIKVIILDVTMPDMSGPEVFEVLRRDFPDLQVIFTSGYDRDDLTRQLADQGRASFLPKPHTPEQLVEEIDRAFRRRARPERPE